jgi:probable F420-dependent oxidoreductase
LKIGVVFPQTEFGADPLAVKDYAQTAEELGYSHILAYDHVLGANPDRPGGWKGPYTYQSSFLEPFVLFSYMAGVTRQIGFTTGIIILPQRQTALVAKQSATLDALSGGRLRVGIGLGWNQVEYEALGQDFHTRGRRSEEQIEVLKLLWTEPLVNFQGRWHNIPDAGLNPLPVQRPIPIWLGGHSERVLQRAARYAQGWMPNYRTPQDAQPSILKIHALLEEQGRAPAGFGFEARIAFATGDSGQWDKLIAGWKHIGATHITLNTMGAGFSTPQEHLDAIRQFAMDMHIKPFKF